MKKRGQLIERTFAHALVTGGMRRVHLRFNDNIAKRALLHVAGFNLGLLMRKRFGVGTPRGLQGRLAAAIAACIALLDIVYEMLNCIRRSEPAEQRVDIASAWLAPYLVAA